MPSEQLLAWMRERRRSGFERGFYYFRRSWHVCGRPVHACYPVPRCPDYVARLVRRDLATYRDSRRIHERYDSCDDAVAVEAAIDHYTVDSFSELDTSVRSRSSAPGRRCARPPEREELEARTGVEPIYTALQAAA